MPYFLLYGVFALWVLFDGTTRKMGGTAVLWTLGTAIFGPIILPVYLASRPLKQGEVREGGRAWNVPKNFAILWTIAMVVATVAGLMAMARGTTLLTSDAARAGAGIGMILGMGVLGAVWFFPAMGSALLAFLLKKNSIVETGPTGPLVGQISTPSMIGGWAGLVGVAIIGLIVVGGATVSKESRVSAPSASSEPSAASSLVAGTNESDWTLTESKNQMDKTPEVVLRKSGSNGSTMMIRCIKNATDVYVDTDTVVDNDGVRVKLDEATPLRQAWTRSTDYRALFAPDPVTFARELAQAKTFLLEFTPFQEGSRTVSFDVTGLDTKLQKVSDACNWEAVDKERAKAKAADEALRERLAQYVHPCKNQDIGKWCWSDPDDVLYNDDQGFSDTREESLRAAIDAARSGLAFTKR